MPITIDDVQPDSPDVLSLIMELDEHLNLQPYPQESRHAFSIEKLLKQGVAFFLARSGGQPAGCCGVKLFGSEYGEV